MCLLEAEGFYPCGQVGFAGIGIEYLTMQELGTRAARSKLFIGLAHVAAARCGKGDDCFTLQIIAFQKCIDDRRSNIPPDRESDKDVNDHQVEFARNVAQRMGTIIPVEDINTLGDIITNYDQIVASMGHGMSSNNAKFNEELEKLVNELY